MLLLRHGADPTAAAVGGPSALQVCMQQPWAVAHLCRRRSNRHSNRSSSSCTWQNHVAAAAVAAALAAAAIAAVAGLAAVHPEPPIPACCPVM